MTTITIKKDIQGLPKEFEDWSDLQEFVLNKLRVQIRSLPQDEISSELLSRVEEAKARYKKSPDSFDNL